MLLCVAWRDEDHPFTAGASVDEWLPILRVNMFVWLVLAILLVAKKQPTDENDVQVVEPLKKARR